MTNFCWLERSKIVRKRKNIIEENALWNFLLKINKGYFTILSRKSNIIILDAIFAKNNMKLFITKSNLFSKARSLIPYLHCDCKYSIQIMSALSSENVFTFSFKQNSWSKKILFMRLRRNFLRPYGKVWRHILLLY